MHKHPLVAKSTMTCPSNPEQYEGQLTDGRTFYFRYRHGSASLGVGTTLDEAVDRSDDTDMRVDPDGRAGQFESDEQRDQVFAELLPAAMTRAGGE